MVETKPVISEKTKQLKRSIEQTFEISDLQSLADLVGTIEKMGYRSIATTLEQLLVDEAAAALSGGCKKKPSNGRPLQASDLNNCFNRWP